MDEIELVVKIPKEVKNRLCFGVTYSKDIQVVCEALNDGTAIRWEKKGFKKTGRHFPQIAEVLKQMQEEK